MLSTFENQSLLPRRLPLCNKETVGHRRTALESCVGHLCLKSSFTHTRSEAFLPAHQDRMGGNGGQKVRSIWGQTVAPRPSALATGETCSICMDSLVQRINKAPLAFKAGRPNKISQWHCLLLLFWMGEEKGGMGAGKTRPRVNCYLRFLGLFKEMRSPPWFRLQIQRGTCGSPLPCSACSWCTSAAPTYCTGHTKVMKNEAVLGSLLTAGLLKTLPSFLHRRSNTQLDSLSISERSPQSS